MHLPIHASPLHSEPRSAVARVLVHLPESRDAEPFIRFTADLGRRCGARLRGLTLIDTSDLQELVSTCESAAYAVYELQRLQSRAERRSTVRACFSSACLDAGLDFDLHVKQGRALDLLAAEAQLHDLQIVALSSGSGDATGEWTSGAVTELILKGSAPVLALKEREHLPGRVLLVHDGTPASSNAIRSYLTQGLFPEAACRLLAVHPDPRDGLRILRENVDYVRRRATACEAGYVEGHPANVVPAFVQQWDADLVVLGAQRRTPMLGFLLGEMIEQVVRKSGASMYSTR